MENFESSKVWCDIFSFEFWEYLPKCLDQWGYANYVITYPVVHSVEQSGNHWEHGRLQRAQVVWQRANISLKEANSGSVHQNHPLSPRVKSAELLATDTGIKGHYRTETQYLNDSLKHVSQGQVGHMHITGEERTGNLTHRKRKLSLHNLSTSE